MFDACLIERRLWRRARPAGDDSDSPSLLTHTPSLSLSLLCLGSIFFLGSPHVLSENGGTLA